MKRSELLPKLKNVRNSVKHLQDAIGELGTGPLMEGVALLPFTSAGRTSIQATGTGLRPDGTTFIEAKVEPPEGLTEELWMRIFTHGDHDPLRSELHLLQKALERALAGVECAIGRKGKPGPKDASAERSSLLWNCLAELIRETGKVPSAKALATRAQGSEAGGNWSREAEKFLAQLRKEASASGYGNSL